MKALFTLLIILVCITNTKAQFVTIQDTSFASWLQNNIPNAMNGNQMDTTHIDVTSRRQVIIQNTHMVSLNGIQYFDSLKTLDCSINVYDTISIRLKYIPALPSMLDTFICYGNSIDSLPTLPGGLIVFDCSQNSLDSLPALPNTIKSFGCWGNQLTSMPTLPDSLVTFNCCNNQLQSLPTLPIGLTTFTCSNNILASLPILPDSINLINCSNNQLQSLPTLPSALAYFDCSINQLSSIPALPNPLVTLYCNNNALTSLPTLPSSIAIIDCSINQLSSLPALPNSLGLLICSSNSITALPTLPNALYKLVCSNNPLSAGLPTLPNSLNILYCADDGLAILPTLPNALQFLDCQSNSLQTIPTLPNSLSTLICSTNPLVTLPALASLNVLECISDQLTNLPALPNTLGFINCSANSLDSLPSLPSSLNQLMCNNNQITSLPTLPPNLAYLDCSFNQIHCFEPFNSISALLNISNNPFTCLPNYIPVMDSVTLLYPLCAAGNPFNCPTSYGIVGFTYKDNNGTCVKDSADTGLKNVPLKIYNVSSNLIGTTYTAMNGVYQFLDSANTYNIVVDTVGKPFVASCQYPGLDSTVTVAVLDTNINFALKCGGGFDIGIQSIATCGIVFPGQTHQLRLNAGDMSHWYNLNCGSGISGIVSFIVTGPVTYMGPVAGALTPNVSGNVFTYNIADFGTINNATDFQILLQPFPTAQAGDVICVNARVTPLNGDIHQANNTYTTCYSVVNSHDPNIKEVYPVDVPYGFNDWLTYTIHFQNTGNAPAFNIKIDDKLDSMLDVSTFQVIDYSHANSTSLIGHNLSVYFANIQLPDSTSNRDNSIGYVQYRIKPKSTWARPYKIKNTAYIYFDFNDAIITNTTLNSILDISTNIEELKESNVAVYPNPTNGLFTIQLESKEKQLVQLYDITGNIVLTQSLENGNGTIDASHLAAGVYTINIKGSESVVNKKLIIVK